MHGSPRPRLSVRRWGSATPQLVLIHGLGDGGFVWESFARLLDPDLAAWALDLRGHGDSDWDPLRRYGIEAYADDVECVLRHVGVSRPVLIGHSLGGAVAIRVAAVESNQVRALVIVDGGPELNSAATEKVAQRFREQPRHYNSVLHYVSCLTERFPLADREDINAFAASALRRSERQSLELKFDPAVADCLPLENPGRVWKALHAVKCPILLVRGAVSGILSKPLADYIAHRLPNCRLACVASAGHTVMLDNSRGFYAALHPFLRAVMAQDPPIAATHAAPSG